MHYVVNVSGGAASAVCWIRAVERYGLDSVSAVFADTNSEHPDTYRFLDDLERHVGQPLTRLDNGGTTIWDVWLRPTFFIANGGCTASWELKQKPLRKHFDDNWKPDEAVILIGMGPDEDDRMERLQRKADGYQFDFPLCWKPWLWRCDVHDVLRERGLKLPELYDKDYPHNNCHGACVHAGIAQRMALLKDYPDIYRRDEENEQKFLAILRERGRPEFTMLKDRRGGTVKNYSLRQLREDVEAGRRVPDDDWGSPCSCMPLFD